MNEKINNKTMIMVQCAVFLAMSFVIRIVEQSFPITMGGVQFMKLGLTSPFTLAPAILFGPAYGFMVGMISDLLNLLTPNPGGSWIPWFTLTAALRGWLVGLIWQWIKGSDPIKMRRWVTGIFSAIGLIGIASFIVGRFLPSTHYAQIIMELNTGEKSIPNIITYGFMASSVVVLLLVFIARRMEKGTSIYAEHRNVNNIFLLFIAVIVPSILQTTLNTFILRSMIAAHADIAFMIYYIPRVAKTLIVGVISVLIIHDVLLLLYRKVSPEMYRKSMSSKDYCKQ
ncbi:MAG TPA: ECF transporter S component [Epulopiscium sp.]|nr:ECF transporter S component [Candidatus Epulonipiscium sp.]